MSTTFPEALRISDRPPAIRVSLPVSGRAQVSARIFAPFTAATAESGPLHTWLAWGGVFTTVALGVLAGPELATVAEAVRLLVQ